MKIAWHSLKLGIVLLCAAASIAADLPSLLYGAVYFRKSNPPEQDWERDYKQASSDGMNAFRHWFMWGSIETSPGKFDWADYDRQLDLAARYGIRTVIGEITHSAPEWAFRKFAHARYEAADGRKVESSIRDSSATGGYPGLCLDNEDYKARAEVFLSELVKRYRNHPATAAYDVWNESNQGSSAFPACYCPATMAKFRDWLKKKYGSLDAVAKAWRRYSFESWEDVAAPRRLNPYPEDMDWVEFRIENAYRLMKWRVDVIRRLDPNHPTTAHGVAGKTLTDHVATAHDAWRAGALVDIYGYSRGSAYEDRIRSNWRRWASVDLTRAGAHGKPFWAAEMSAGPIWEMRDGSKENGRIPRGHDVRVANFIGMAGGVTGIFSARWRPVLEGPLFGALAFYGMDGSPTDRSEMGGEIARWANAPERGDLWKSRPVQGDVGVVFVPESEIHATLLNNGSSEPYASSAEGAYRAFLENSIQADWVHIDDIDRYHVLYLPYPVMLPERAARHLMSWVEAGGSLISEACPAYFGDGGRAGTKQPNQGLDKLFGAVEQSVEFTPDLLSSLTFRAGNRTGVGGGINLQSYRLAGGTASGWFSDGSVAMVDHTFGKGRTRLVGTHPGAAYSRGQSEASRAFFADLLAWAGKEQRIRRTGSPNVRLHEGPGGTYLWIVNPEMKASPVEVTLSERVKPFRSARAVWGMHDRRWKEGRFVSWSPPWTPLY